MPEFVETNRSGVAPPGGLVEFVINQYQAGRSLREIAELTDRTHGAVRNILDRAGVRRRERGAPLMNSDLIALGDLDDAPPNRHATGRPLIERSEVDLGDVVIEFVMMPVGELPPMHDEDAVRAVNAQSDERYADVEWLLVAQIAGDAIRRRSAWSMDAWCDLAAAEHLERAENRYGFEALFDHVITVSPDTWIEGQHRALFMIDAGTEAIQVQAPEPGGTAPAPSGVWTSHISDSHRALRRGDREKANLVCSPWPPCPRRQPPSRTTAGSPRRKWDFDRGLHLSPAHRPIRAPTYGQACTTCGRAVGLPRCIL